MVLFKDMLPGTRIFVDYFGKVKKANTLMQDVSSYEREKEQQARARAEPRSHQPQNHINRQLPAPCTGTATTGSGRPIQPGPLLDGATGPPVYFLSHFHSDHFMGMEKNWEPPAIDDTGTGISLNADYHPYAKVYCTQTSARLLDMIFQLRRNLVVACELQKPFLEPVFERYVFCLVDGNHCPGSSVILILVLHNGKKYVNTGDFRFYPEIGDNVRKGFEEMEAIAQRVWGRRRDQENLLNSSKALKIKSRIEMCFLDFSWADESFDLLPDKQTSVDRFLALVEKNYLKHKKRKIFLHSYGLGDEELLQAVTAKYRTETFLFADERRFLELRACGFFASGESRRRNCVLYSPNYPNIDQVRFFVVKNSAQRQKVMREIDHSTVTTDRPDQLRKMNLPAAAAAPAELDEDRIVSRTKAVEEMELTEKFVEISCTTMWWCYNKHLLIQLGAAADVCPAVLDEQGIWRVLWAMHSPLRELRAFVAMVKPRFLKPVCAVIQAGHYEVTEADKSRAQKCFEGLFGDSVLLEEEEGEESQVFAREVVADEGVRTAAVNLKGNLDEEEKLVPAANKSKTGAHDDGTATAIGAADSNASTPQKAGKNGAFDSPGNKRPRSPGSAARSVNGEGGDRDRTGGKRKRRKRTNVRATHKNVVQEKDGDAFLAQVFEGIDFSPEQERRHALDAFHRSGKNTALAGANRGPAKEHDGNLHARIYEQRIKQKADGGQLLQQKERGGAFPSAPPVAGAPPRRPEKAATSAQEAATSAFGAINAPLAGKDNTKTVAELRAVAAQQQNTKRGRALLGNFFKARDAAAENEQEAEQPIMKWHKGQRVDANWRPERIEIDHNLNRTALAVVNASYYKRRKFKYASDLPLDVAAAKQSEYKAKLRGQGLTDEEIERKMTADVVADGEKGGMKQLRDPSSLEPETDHSDLLLANGLRKTADNVLRDSSMDLGQDLSEALLAEIGRNAFGAEEEADAAAGRTADGVVGGAKIAAVEVDGPAKRDKGAIAYPAAVPGGGDSAMEVVESRSPPPVDTTEKIEPVPRDPLPDVRAGPGAASSQRTQTMTETLTDSLLPKSESPRFVGEEEQQLQAQPDPERDDRRDALAIRSEKASAVKQDVPVPVRQALADSRTAKIAESDAANKPDANIGVASASSSAGLLHSSTGTSATSHQRRRLPFVSDATRAPKLRKVASAEAEKRSELQVASGPKLGGKSQQHFGNREPAAIKPRVVALPIPKEADAVELRLGPGCDPPPLALPKPEVATAVTPERGKTGVLMGLLFENSSQESGSRRSLSSISLGRALFGGDSQNSERAGEVPADSKSKSRAASLAVGEDVLPKNIATNAKDNNDTENANANAITNEKNQMTSASSSSSDGNAADPAVASTSRMTNTLSVARRDHKNALVPSNTFLPRRSPTSKKQQQEE